MKIKGRAGVAAAVVLAGATVHAQIPAFPGAEGFGAYANGGRGGDVYTVTSLNNSGSGTLREALDTAPAGGRTIVFAVSGYIPVVSDTNFQVPDNVTIAGQTAPGDGVGLKGGRMLVNGDHVVIRHFRIRHGKYGTGGDCLNFSSGVDNTIIDHISMMFSTDENFSFFEGGVNDFTMQYSTSAWGMERHNAGGLWTLDSGSCHHSLWAHHYTRNPKARPDGLLEWINNVTFGYDTGFIMGDSTSPATWKANVVGCYYLSIPTYRHGVKENGLVSAQIDRNGSPNFSLHLDDCLYDYDDDGTLNGTDRGYDIVEGVPYPDGGTVEGTKSYAKYTTPFTGAPEAVSSDDPLTAYKKVISSGGALRLNASAASLRDELDTLLINSVVNQESIMVAKDSPVLGNAPPSNGEQHLADVYGISNNGFGTLSSTAALPDSDGDGMPDKWEQALGSDPGVQDHNTLFGHNGSIITDVTFFPANTPAGYTYLEEYLHFRAIPHAIVTTNSVASPMAVAVDLSRYTRGFDSGAVFTVSGAYGGTVQQFAADGTTLSTSGPVVVFTPTLNVAGRAGFEFNVTDSDGSSWTQPFAILVAPDTGYVAPPRLEAKYSMEGSTGDDSGRGNDGTASGSPAYAAGRVGQAINLDGVDDYISLPSAVAVSDDITIAAWVKWDGGAAWQRIFDFGTGTEEFMFLTAANDAGQLRFGFKTAAEYPNLYAAGLATGVWTHVAVTLDGDLGTLYVNGTVVDAQPIVNNPSDLLPNILYVGRSQWSNNPDFDGRIDDFRIYNYALGAVDIAALAEVSGNLKQAEDSGYGGGSAAESDNAGFNGTGYINFPSSGGYLEFNEVNGGTGGDALLEIRYALGAAGTRTGSLIVNGMPQSITFNSTSAWNTWVTVSLTVTLEPGAQNTIRFESTGEDLANIDQILVEAPGVDNGAPAAPGGLGALGLNARVMLDWEDNTEADLAGYSIYRSTTGGSVGPMLATGVTSSTFADSAVTNGIEYYYVVTATDTNGNESAVSGEVGAMPRPSADPVAYYRFEEGAAGSDVVPGGNAVIDSAGGDDHMNAYNADAAPTYSADAPVSPVPQSGQANALSTYFDGSDDVYNAVAGPLITAVFNDFTVEAYVKFSSLTGFQTFVGRDDNNDHSAGGQDGNTQSLFYLSKHDDNHFRVSVSTLGGDMLAVEGAAIATAGTWYHVAAVGDASAGTLTLFVDGVNVGSTSGYDGLFDPAENNAWTIGRGQYNGYTSDKVVGYIDEVRWTAGALASGYFLNAPDPDQDGDGLDDAWEREHFGNLNQSGTDDADGDGEDNATEFANGTPPTISSIPPVIDVAIDAGSLHLNWSSNHAGWRLLFSTNLLSDTWIEVPGSDSTNAYETPVGGSPDAHEFFQLVYP